MSNKNCCKKTSIGGQAVIEGIMMRGPQKTVLAVRTPDSSIIVEEVKSKSITDKLKFLKKPVIRGVVGFVETMILGFKTLMRSAELSGMTALEEEEESKKKELKLRKKADKKGITYEELLVQEESKNKKSFEIILNIVMFLSSIFGVALSVFLFIYLPSYIFDGIELLANRDIKFIAPLVEGLIKVILFISYILAVSYMKEIKRVFQYHGAEHKTIFCYEKGLDLTVENVRKQKRFHPRCGTSFMFLMIAVSILVSTVLVLVFPSIRENTFIWSTIKILLVPTFVGLGYELIKICGKYDNVVTRIIAAPGLWIQRITTKEPDDSMIEVAIESILAVIPQDQTSDNW